MNTDLKIAQAAVLEPIDKIAHKAGIPEEYLEMYGKEKAKVNIKLMETLRDKPDGKLVLVTAINPTKAGEGKSTTTIGLADGLSKVGKNVMACLREPSLGPVFGLKGGATGGGYAQVVPMESINLHFTGDMHAITTANNLIAAILDNSIFQGNPLNIDPTRVTWKRCLDMNDRTLRDITIAQKKKSNGVEREDHFVITVASEVMAILCLSKDLQDFEKRIGKAVVAYTYDDQPVTVNDIQAAGAATVVMKEAINPNLVQTLEHTPTFIHGGPFANIAHGCNSVMATKMAMTFGDYAITEAGFGADLGAEKFFDIKCRKAGIAPKLTVLVATAQALKMHGGVNEKEIKTPNVEGVRRGLANMDKHIANMQAFGQTVVVCLNRFATDTDEELDVVRRHCEEQGVGFALNTAFGEGGKGAEEIARLVVETIEKNPSKPLKMMYEDADDIETKVRKIAQNIYGANDVVLKPAAKKKLARIKELGLEHFPVCIAKTQYSFSEDAKAYGLPTNFDITIRDFVINTGSEMIVAVAGDIMRMPGLPKSPQAERIDVVNGVIEGLS